jgi:hypothetical protein
VHVNALSKSLNLARGIFFVGFQVFELFRSCKWPSLHSIASPWSNFGFLTRNNRTARVITASALTQSGGIGAAALLPRPAGG